MVQVYIRYTARVCSIKIFFADLAKSGPGWMRIGQKGGDGLANKRPLLLGAGGFHSLEPIRGIRKQVGGEAGGYLILAV